MGVLLEALHRVLGPPPYGPVRGSHGERRSEAAWRILVAFVKFQSLLPTDVLPLLESK
jgi:hypothetical protein